MRLQVLGLVLLCSCTDGEKDEATDDTQGVVDTEETDDSQVDTQGEPVDADEDGFTDDVDCDDANAEVNPDAEEVCDDVDNDCDGLVDDDDDPVSGTSTWYEDADGDGYGNADTSQEACATPTGYVADDTDCDDRDGAYHPGADESDCTDENDYNCDGSVGFADGDGDGFAACDDCDDTVASTNPLAFEVCDGADNDCDGTVDEDDAVDVSAWYADNDSDGYGDSDTSVEACDLPSGFVDDDTDCEDADSAIHPDAIEVCDSVDNDCDGWIDDVDPDVSGTTTFYADSDGDGYGGSQFQQDACVAPTGFVTSSDDCDDLDPVTYPGAVEICDEADNDCDTEVDEGVQSTWYEDADSDGFGDASVTQDGCEAPLGYVGNDQDCDDQVPTTNPSAYEVCDSVDNNCDGHIDESTAIDTDTFYLDADGDGYGVATSTEEGCSASSGYASDIGDCDDGNAQVNPGADEVCDSVDNDCDGSTDEDSALDAGTWYGDGDGDGYGWGVSTTVSCDQPSGHVSDGTDCNDSDASISPGATETCDSVDNDCDGTVDEDDAADASPWYIDGDGDGYGNSAVSSVNCSAPSGYVADSSDCNDADPAISPGATEVCADAVDNDCSGDADGPDSSDASNWYADADGDTFGDPNALSSSCTQPSGYVADSTDCYDGDPNINPGGTEVCGDGLDNDCSGDADGSDSSDASTWYEDADADGYGNSSSTLSACTQPSGYLTDSTDCNDGSALANPGGTEVCGDGLDNDCSGDADGADSSDASTWYEDADSDGYGDSSSTLAACTQPSDYVTDSTDCNDGSASASPGGTEVCGDGLDNDCSGDADGADASDAVTYYADSDSDSAGDPGTSTTACSQPSGYVIDDSDCNDSNASSTRCSSCESWKSFDDQGDGVYTIDPEGNGSTFDVYCEMTTSGGGWTLFAITDASRCAESLNYGSSELTSLTATPYLTTIAQGLDHDEFLQILKADGSTTNFTIVYGFTSGTKTLSSRIDNAVSSGEAVNWVVTDSGGTAFNLSGTWRYSNGAATSSKWSGSGSNFANDDGSWGAGSGTVDGNSPGPHLNGINDSWGHENHNSGDGECQYYYEDGTQSSNGSLRNFMYLR